MSDLIARTRHGLCLLASSTRTVTGARRFATTSFLEDSMSTRNIPSDQLLARFRAAAERTAEQQRAIQVEVDRKDERAAKEKKGEKESKRAVQAGTRTQPETPLPKQHLAKPGLEVELEPRPRYLAP